MTAATLTRISVCTNEGLEQQMSISRLTVRRDGIEFAEEEKQMRGEVK